MPSLTLPARDLELHLPHLHPLQHPPHHHNASHTQLALPFPSPTSHPQAAPITAPGATSTMPTPESELFLAKKPKVAPTFEGVDYDDNVALKAAQDAIIREQWVKSMMARLVREEMGKCYRREGVNHL